MAFRDRALDMGLTVHSEGVYQYIDRHSSVMYQELKTNTNFSVPLLGVFTRRTPRENEDAEQWAYVGYVSDGYQFVGNDAVLSSIRDSISEVGSPIFTEHTFMNEFYTMMLNEMLIQNVTNHPEVGDIYPNIIVTNSYNGSRAVRITFGISISESEGNPRVGFGFQTFGQMRQVHYQHSRSRMSTAVGAYIDIFSQNIISLIEENFNQRVSEENMLAVLDVIENSVGKRRRNSLSMYLEEIGADNITSWNLFHSICRFSSIEKNLNARILMEDVAESVLTIPSQMFEAVATLEAARQAA